MFYDCIPIHGNTVFTSFSISPDLPQDLSIDKDRSCIGGTYTGSYYGSQAYHLKGSNYLGEVSTWITLYFSRNRFNIVLMCSHTPAGTERSVLRGTAEVPVHVPLSSLVSARSSYQEEAVQIVKLKHDKFRYGISIFLLRSHVHSDYVFRVLWLLARARAWFLLVPHRLRVQRRQGENRACFLMVRIAIRSACTWTTN